MRSGDRPDERWTVRLSRWMTYGLGLWKEEAKRSRKSAAVEESAPFCIRNEDVERLKEGWERQLREPAEVPEKLPDEERKLVDLIIDTTARENRNNVTRTAAYWSIYRNHPELHWAFLAHMVSRNGGWSMTDLQGDLLPRLLGEKQRQSLFLFLERVNALIFQDAYPQLLLYEWSMRRGRSLFHLLPYFHVSAFMKPLWDLFWEKRDPLPLTVGLIVNEQHYIEGRVVRNEFYQTHVFGTLAFHVQSLMQLNQVLFPYAAKPSKALARSHDLPYRLAGLVMEDFTDLQERIRIGKQLYAILFGVPGVLDGTTAFASVRPHSGSRSDYWPHLFASVKKALPSQSYTERLTGCKLREGAAPLYSPALIHAWPDFPVEPPKRYDWFENLACADYFTALEAPNAVDMTAKACAGINKIELAVMAGQKIGL